MSVKNFKFVSPGVFINEIDNSFIPKSPTAIGPVVIGRATQGLSMQPVKAEAYSDFVTMFGDTVPGRAGGDVYRNGLDTQSPIYGLYGAKAFMQSNVAPLTYVRVLGHDHPSADTAEAPHWSSQAGWRTQYICEDSGGGGAFGLFIWPSGVLCQTASTDDAVVGMLNNTQLTGTLAAVWYLEAGSMALSGTLVGSASTSAPVGALGRLNATGVGAMMVTTNGKFKAVHTDSEGTSTTYEFTMDDSNSKFVRQVFNTNPQLYNSGNFYPAASEKDYWLGETYEQDVRDLVGASQNLFGAIVPITLSGSLSAPKSPANMVGIAAREAVAGWFVGQDTGVASSFNPTGSHKLFRLKGRGHGAWLTDNVKVSISNIRQSNTSTTDYGTFSVLLRRMDDSDNALQIVERYDNLNLDPTSPNYIARKIGDQYQEWDETQKRLKLYGEYPNQSKFVYVHMNDDVGAGASGLEKLLPFGYYGPPKYKDFSGVVASSGSSDATAGAWPPTQAMVAGIQDIPGTPYVIFSTASAVDADYGNTFTLSGAFTGSSDDNNPLSARGVYFTFPSARIRISASAGGITDPRRAFFGFSSTRSSGSTKFDPSVPGTLRPLSTAVVDDPTTTSVSGMDGFAYIFTMDNVVGDAGTTGSFYYESGSRTNGYSYSAKSGGYTELLDAGYNSFTAPLWGGWDGFNIKLPDPLYNDGMTTAATEKNNAAYYSLKRAIDSVADPEMADMNLLSAPGLTNISLTQHIVNICESRADAMGIIDLPDVYLPSAEGQYSGKSTKASRIATTPQQAATSLKDRGINSSYGCTFYPWVQTRDATTGAAVWLPPSVAMLGVLASSEKKAQLWFAPAGFNRGGLSEGAAGIPISAVTEKLTAKQRDVLYEASINPIASFPSSGIVVFGQKTLQERRSSLDRINVRRLVIYLKKQISIVSTKILFEQNVQTTWNRFMSLVEPLLANVKSNFGISDYKLILDESTTTPDLIDQNIMYAKIMVKPARAIEYIAIDFVIASTGASFDD